MSAERVDVREVTVSPTETASPSSTSNNAGSEVQYTITMNYVGERSGLRSTQPIRIDRLYPDVLNNEHSTLGRALDLLSKAITNLLDALKALSRSDAFEADDFSSKTQSLLPELFCCRSLGDGFGTAVNAVSYAYANAKGIPLVRKQLQAIQNVFLRLHAEPYLDLDAALDLIHGLEAADLMVDPPELESLAEILDNEGLH